MNYDFDDDYIKIYKQKALLDKKQELKSDLECLTRRYSTRSNATCIKNKNIQKNYYRSKGGKKKENQY